VVVLSVVTHSVPRPRRALVPSVRLPVGAEFQVRARGPGPVSRVISVAGLGPLASHALGTPQAGTDGPGPEPGLVSSGRWGRRYDARAAPPARALGGGRIKSPDLSWSGCHLATARQSRRLGLLLVAICGPGGRAATFPALLYKSF